MSSPTFRILADPHEGKIEWRMNGFQPEFRYRDDSYYYISRWHPLTRSSDAHQRRSLTPEREELLRELFLRPCVE